MLPPNDSGQLQMSYVYITLKHICTAIIISYIKHMFNVTCSELITMIYHNNHIQITSCLILYKATFLYLQLAIDIV